MKITQRTPIEDVTSSDFDVIIVGGGINGVSTFRDLALNGISVLLVDKQDFCAGTSAAPSRLIHGGIKYLENGEFRLVAESTVERNRLLHNASHLVTPIPCTVPFESRLGGLFNSAFRFFRLPVKGFKKRGTLVVRVGMIIYDWMGRKFRVMPRHKINNKKESHRMFPGLNPAVIATGTYYDARVTQPERLCLELVTDTLRDVAGNNQSCIARSYTSLAGTANGKLTLKDELNGQTFQVQAGLVINAAGPWIDKVNQELGIQSQYIGGSKGSHLILDHPEMQRCLNDHMLYFETGDGRLCLAYSIGKRVLIGATDIRVDDPDGVECDDDEIDYLIAAMGELLPGVEITREHIVYKYVGVRPLPYDDGVNVGAVSRDHSIEIDEPTESRPYTVASLVGGKWTTFRAFGEVAADLAMQRLGVERRASTCDLAIGGARAPGWALDADLTSKIHEKDLDAKSVFDAVDKKYQLSPDLVTTMLGRYGYLSELMAKLSESAESREALVSLDDYRRGEFQFMCEHEMISHLDDIVFRRTTIALEGRASDDVIEEIASIASQSLNWDQARKQTEIELCTQKVRHQSVTH